MLLEFLSAFQCFDFCRHADVMKKIIQMVAEGGGDLGVHVYPWLHKKGGGGDFEVPVMVVVSEEFGVHMYPKLVKGWR